MLSDHIDEFEKRNVKLISIASDSIGLLRRFKEEYDFKVDMISDRGATIAKDYNVNWYTQGMGSMKTKQAVPSKFLINKSGEIVWKYVGRDKTDRPTTQMMALLMDKYL
jgi:peroxiredoxin